jgi:predicted amidophosphoribosyltransferase
MYRHSRVDFNLGRNAGRSDLRVMVKGPDKVLAMLQRAFPALQFRQRFDDQYGVYDWGVFIKHVGPDVEADIRAFLNLIRDAVLLDDDLNESFALAWHSASGDQGMQRTPMGQMVYEAKPYGAYSPGNRAKAKELAAKMTEFIQAQPTYRRAGLVVPLPPSNPDKAFDLPTELALEIARLTGKAANTQCLRKLRSTKPMKDCQTDGERKENIKGAFAADPTTCRGQTLILVDDIYDSGLSMNEAGRALRSAGAKLLLGLTATKTTHS